MQMKHLTSYSSALELLNATIIEINKDFTGEADQSGYYRNKI